MEQDPSLTQHEAFFLIIKEYDNNIDAVPGFWKRKKGKIEIEQEKTITQDGGCDI